MLNSAINLKKQSTKCNFSIDGARRINSTDLSQLFQTRINVHKTNEISFKFCYLIWAQRPLYVQNEQIVCDVFSKWNEKPTRPNKKAYCCHDGINETKYTSVLDDVVHQVSGERFWAEWQTVEKQMEEIFLASFLIVFYLRHLNILNGFISKIIYVIIGQCYQQRR